MSSSAGRRASYYDPVVDRSSLYSLPRRARFWPGSDQLQGDEWHRCYGDIQIPAQLNTPRTRPSCLQNERNLENLLVERQSRRREEQQVYNEKLAQARAMRATSVLPQTTDKCHCIKRDKLRARSVQRGQDDYESHENNERLSKLRNAKSALLNEQDCLLTKERVAAKEATRYLETVRRSQTQHSSKQTKCTSVDVGARDYLGLDGNEVHVPCWTASHPIKEQSQHRPPPAGSLWPEKRPFYDLKSDYNAMLSFMGVPRT